MKALILVGSSDKQSHSLALGNKIGELLESKVDSVEVMNLADTEIPLYNRAIEREASYSNKVKEFLEQSVEADIIVWVTPIYHNSFSGTLKNALDWQHKTKFDGKVLGLASNGGNRSPQAVDQLMLVARSQGYITVPKRVCTQESDYDENLNLTDENILSRTNDFVEQLVSLANKIR